MSFRRSLPVMLLTAVCVLSVGAVSAQNVFVSPRNPPPQDNPPSPPPPPAYTPPPATVPTAPRTGGATTAQRPALPPNIAPPAPRTPSTKPPIDLPDYSLRGEEADFAARHLGITDDGGNGMAALQRYSPEEIAAVRASFDNMAKTNPEMAALNPINMIELMARSQRAQDALSDRLNAACNEGRIEVMISQTTFNGKPAAEANLQKNGLTPLGNVLADLCSDPVTRKQVASGIFMLTIVNKPGLPKAELISGSGVLTLTDDFTRTEGLPPPQMKSTIKEALAAAARDNAPAPAGLGRHEHGR